MAIPDGYNSYPSIVGQNNANNDEATDLVVGNADGTVVERLEALKSQLTAIASTDLGAVLTAIEGAGFNTAVDSLKILSDVLDLIKAKTDNLPVSPAATADIANALVDTNIVVGAPLRKEVTFNNTNADVALFTVTGAVRIRMYAVCTTGLASAGGCNIGVKAGTVDIIPATASTDLLVGEVWADATPTLTVEAEDDAKLEYIIGDGGDISIDVEALKQVDSGALTFYLEWSPITSNGNIVVA